MGTGLKIGIISLILIVILVATVVGVGIGISNREVRLRNQFNAQQENCKVVYDETWKVLKQLAGLTDKYADDFKSIYVDVMEARYENGGGSLMKWVQERNPNFNDALYLKLASAIEGKRATFSREQKKLLDLKREHDDLRGTFPSNLICSNRPALEAQIVTSGNTKEVYRTGEENDIELFEKDK